MINDLLVLRNPLDHMERTGKIFFFVIMHQIDPVGAALQC